MLSLMESRPQKPPGAGCLAMPVRSNQEAHYLRFNQFFGPKRYLFFTDDFLSGLCMIFEPLEIHHPVALAVPVVLRWGKY